MDTPARLTSGLNPYFTVDDLEVITDDHTELSSQIIHLVALLKACSEGRFATARLIGEAVRLTEVLQVQLAEHFALEEVSAFQQLGESYPEVKPRFQALLAQHDGVFAAFEQLRSALRDDPMDLARLFALAAAFEGSFEQHATEEDLLLSELTASGRS